MMCNVMCDVVCMVCIVESIFVFIVASLCNGSKSKKIPDTNKSQKLSFLCIQIEAPFNHFG